MSFFESIANLFSLEGTVLVLLLVGLFAYVRFLRGVRERVDPEPEPITNGPLSDTELERYARHIVLREIGGPGQMALRRAKVLVVGAGGLGNPVLQYLAAAGVGTLGVIDDDVVSLSNLQRQVMFDEDQLDKPKVFAAADKINALNPFVQMLTFNRRLDDQNGTDIISEFDLVLDGTDRFDTRQLVNRICVATKTPLISGAISQWEGQISLFYPADNGPCYACMFDKQPTDGQAPTCAEAGVMGALPGVVGSMMAAEAIKWITAAGTSLKGQMVIYDALYGESRKIKVARRSDCAVCGSNSQKV